MVDNNIQAVQQATTSGGAAAAEAALSQAENTRQKVRVLAQQFQVTGRVAGALYRGIVKKDPNVSPASLLAQFAQAVSKRKLKQANEAEKKSAGTSAGNSANTKDTLSVGGPSVTQFLVAAPAANTSNLNQQEFKQVTQNATAGPVLPPPKPRAVGTQAPELAHTVSKMVLLNPNHPNWQAFMVLLMDSMNEHAIDRALESKQVEQHALTVQITSAETSANIAQADIWKERREALYSMAGSTLQSRTDFLDALSKRLVNANPVDDVHNIDFTTATTKQQMIGQFGDLLRSDAIAVMSGMRAAGTEGKFMDADEGIGKSDNLLKTSRTKPADMKEVLEPYAARQDDVSRALRAKNMDFVERLKRNEPLPENLDGVILGQALPGHDAMTEDNRRLRVDRRFLTKAEIESLSPEMRRQDKEIMRGFYAARVSDVADCVQDIQHEVLRLRSGAQVARDSAQSGKQCPPGADVEVYKKNCDIMARALEKKADDLTHEHLDGLKLAKQIIQHEPFSNRISMRSAMQHIEWLQDIANGLRKEFEAPVNLAKVEPREEFNILQRKQLCFDTLSAINRRIYDLQQAVKSYRGDAHQPKGEPLKRNERLDKFESAPGASLFNQKWDAYEALQAKPKQDLTQDDHAEMVKLRTYLSEMHDAAPANVWEPWKLERLYIKRETARSNTQATPQEVQDAEAHFRKALKVAQDRVDGPWLAHLMNKHVKARTIILTEDMSQKVLNEKDPAKKAVLLQEQRELAPRLAAREADWANLMGYGKLNTAKQKAKTVITSLGFGPSITYSLRPNHTETKSVPHRNHAKDAVEAQKAQQQDPIVCAHDDGWLADNSPFKHVDPGVDYNNPRALNTRLEEANEARGAALDNWNDKAATQQMATVEGILRGRDSIKDAMDQNRGVAINFAEEGVGIADGVVQGLKGDRDSAYGQIAAMASRLLPLIGKISPWG